MIGHGKQSVILDVNGVGFQVVLSASDMDRFGELGREVTLFTHLQVREDGLTLYGFSSEEARELFELLLTVSGIGPKVAMALLSAFSPDDLQKALVQEDIGALSRVPGIGPKTARNLVFHLRDKIQTAPVGPSLAALAEADAEVISALTSLGYSVLEAQRAVQSLPREELPLEERIRLALAYFSR
ncbi:MAG: Holliday junction branch migration protein RuvA [Anaerolineae bacterium]|nr:Holliday junction branch migration protein RuvA [Anaerolineae bacterium]